MAQNWATYLKVRLNCSIPGEFPFFFNEIQDVYKAGLVTNANKSSSNITKRSKAPKKGYFSWPNKINIRVRTSLSSLE